MLSAIKLIFNLLLIAFTVCTFGVVGVVIATLIGFANGFGELLQLCTQTIRLAWSNFMKESK